MKYRYYESGYSNECNICKLVKIYPPSKFRYEIRKWLYYTKYGGGTLVCTDCIEKYEKIDADWALGFYTTDWDDYRYTQFCKDEIPF